MSACPDCGGETTARGEAYRWCPACQVHFKNEPETPVTAIAKKTDHIDTKRIRADIEAAETPKQAKDIADKASAIRRYLKKAGADLGKRNDIAEVEVEALWKCGALLGEMADSKRLGPGRPPKKRSQDATISLGDLGIKNKSESSRMQALAKLPAKGLDAYFKGIRAKQDAPVREASKEITRAAAIYAGLAYSTAATEAERKTILRLLAEGASPAEAKRAARRTEKRETLEAVATKQIRAAEGTFDVLVIDPPWPMTIIERDERPNQVELDYPTMAEEELADMKLPCAEDCHVWVWTTHRFLPMALRLLDVWALKYVCTFVWHKPGGFQPIGLPQYNCEFALYARRGSPEFLDTKAFPTCFEAPRGAHSEKPEAFYEMVRRVTAGRRLDMFNRRAIEGFEGWGKEAADAAE